MVRWNTCQLVGARLSAVSGLMDHLSVVRWLVVGGRWVDGAPVGGLVVGGRWPVGGRWFCNTPGLNGSN